MHRPPFIHQSVSSQEKLENENIKLIDLEQGLTLGYKLKLVSISERHNKKFYSSVAPCFIPENSLVAKTDFEENVISLEGDNFLKSSLVGKGAGGYPTATSIISDLKRYLTHTDEKGIFKSFRLLCDSYNHETS